MSKVKTALVQMSCGTDKQQNLDKAIEKIKEAYKRIEIWKMGL